MQNLRYKTAWKIRIIKNNFKKKVLKKFKIKIKKEIVGNSNQ